MKVHSLIAMLMIAGWAATAAADSEVWLSARTDGKAGTGTAVDPFNASTQDAFDRLFAGFGSNTAIHLGPGTYHTKGRLSFEVKSYWKIRGAGYEVTRIIQDRTDKIHCTVFCGRAEGVEIEDLSIDCGFQNQQVVNGKIKANAAAIGVWGSHIAVRRCLVKNYGSPYDDETGENFAVFIGSASPANGENLVVEDCIFAGMSPLLRSGQSVLTIAGGPAKNDLRAGNWARGCIARRNHFTGYHFGCHGITMSGTQGGMIIENVFEHFMGACVYQDTWPMRDIIIANNIFSDVQQGIRLAGDGLPMNNFQIRDNMMLMHDGFDIVKVTNGLVTTAINHCFIPGMHVKFRKVDIIAGDGLTGDAYVTSTPGANTFTYSLTAGGSAQTTDAGTGGCVQGQRMGISRDPEAIAIFSGSGDPRFRPTNFVIARNVIKPYSSDDVARVPSIGIAVAAMQNSQIINNIVFDAGPLSAGSEGIDEILDEKVPPGPDQRADLLVCAVKGYTPTVICRDNYHPDGTPLLPRDGTFKIIENGLMDLPLEAGRNVTLTPTNGRIRIDVSEMPPVAHAAAPADLVKNRHAPGKPGDTFVQGGFLFIYTGDGAAHQWKRCALLDY
jgi:hypothetical protein